MSAAALLALSTFQFAPAADAANTIYTDTSTTGNWSGATFTQTGPASGHAVPDSTDAGNVVRTPTADATLILDTPLTIGGLLLDNGQANFTLTAGGPAITMDGTGITTASGAFVDGEAFIFSNQNATSKDILTINPNLIMASNLALGGVLTNNSVVIGGTISNGTASLLSLNLRESGATAGSALTLVNGAIGADRIAGAGGISITNLSSNVGGVTLAGAIGGATGSGTSADGAAVSISNLSTGTGDFTLSGALNASVSSVLQNSATSRMILTGVNANFTGTTTISAGALQANNGAGLSAASFLSLDGGVLQSNGVASFTRALGTSGGSAFQFTANGGGFAANGGLFTVNIGAAAAELVWGATVGSNLVGVLQFGSTTANNKTLLVNGIDLNGTTRTVNVTAGAGGDSNEISGVVRTSTGTAGLTKTGNGTLSLTAANTYNGTTTISGGALQGVEGVGIPTNFLSLDGGVFQSSGVASFTRGLGTSGASKFQLTANGGGFSANGGQLTINIGGASNELVWGSTVGTTLVGPLLFGSNTANNKTLFLNGIDLNGATRTVSVTAGAGGDSNEISGVVRTSTGTAGLIKTGTGALTLSANNTYNGATTISSGTLNASVLGNDGETFSSIGAPTGAANRTITLGGLNGTSGVLTYTGPATTTDHNFFLDVNAGGGDAINSSGSGKLTLTGTVSGAHSVTFGGTQAGEAAGVISTTAGNVNIGGSSTWTFSNANTYTVPTVINSGTLKLGTAGNATNSPLGTIGNGTTVNATGAALDLNGFTLATAEPLALSGTGVATGGALTNSGAAASYSGLLKLNAASSIVASGGSIALTNPGTITGATFLLTLDGPTTGNSISSIIGTTTGGLTKTGTGTWALNGNNTYTGTTTLLNGTLVMNGSFATNAIAISGGTGTTLLITNPIGTGTGVINTNTGATNPNIQFHVDGGGTTTYGYAFGGNSGITTTFDVNNNGTGTNGTIVLNGTLGTSAIGTITLNVTGGNGYSLAITNLRSTAGTAGTSTFNPTTANLSFTTITGSQATGTNTWVFGGTATGNTVKGVISNATAGAISAVTKSNTSTWTFTGTSTYTGATIVNGGKLVLGSGGNLNGTSGVTLSGLGTTLAVTPGVSVVTNNIAGFLTLGAGTSLSMADGAASTLTVGGAGTFTGGTGSSLSFDLGGTTTATDQIVIAGAGAETAATVVTINGFGATPVAGTSFTLISAASGTLNGGTYTLSSNRVSVGGQAYNLTLTPTATSLVLNVSASIGQASAYYTGKAGAAALNATASGGTVTNFSTDSAGAADFGTPGPGTVQDLIFTATTVTTPQTIASLGQNYNVNSLQFTSTAPAITLNDTAGNTLTLNAGITVASGSAAQTINAPIVVAAAQTFANNSTSPLTIGNVSTGASLLSIGGTGNTVLGGVIAGTAGLNINTSGGTATVTGAANAYTGITAINSGTLALSGGNNRLPTATTVKFTGASGTFDVGSTSQTIATLSVPNTVATGVNQSVFVTGAGGSLTVNGATDLQLGPFTSANTVTVNLSGLSNFTYNSPTKAFRVGLQSGGTSTGATGQVANVTLGTNNSITALLIAVADQQATSNPGAATLNLGQTNTLNATTFNVGSSGRSGGTLQFAPGLTNPTATLRGLDGTSPAASFLVGKVANNASTTWTDLVDFSAGTLDAAVTTVLIGNVDAGTNTARQGVLNASFVMGAGTATVGSLTLGQIANTGGDGTTTGTTSATYSGNGTFTLNNAAGTLNATTITLAANTITAATGTARTVSGTFNLTNGLLKATTIAKGAQTGTATATVAFNWANGTVQNTDAADLSITGVPINLAAGTHTFNATGTQNINVDAASPITGVGFSITKAGTGTLNLAAPSTYSGATFVNGGTLKAGVATVAGTSGAFGNSSAVVLANTAGAGINITGFNTQIGSLSGGGSTGGNVALGAATLTVGADNTSPAAFGGSISGTGALIKNGTGILTLTGVNAYTGSTSVTGGGLVVHGSLAAASTVSVTGGGTVAGGVGATAGNVGGPVTLTNGTVSPGSNITAATVSAAILNVGGLTLPAAATSTSKLLVDLPTSAGQGGAANAGVSYDQIDVLSNGGPLSLNNAILALNDAVYAASGHGAETFVLLRNLTSSNTGTFSLDGTIATAIADGTTFTAAGGSKYTLQYNVPDANGIGSDVVLTSTAVPEPVGIGLLGIAAASLVGRRRRRVAPGAR